MQKKSAIRTKPIPQRTKETSNCCGSLRFLVSSSRKVYGSPNLENWNLARPRYTKNLLWVGSSRFFARERSERIRSTDTAIHKRKNARFNRRVCKYKQLKTHNVDDKRAGQTSERATFLHCTLPLHSFLNCSMKKNGITFQRQSIAAYSPNFRKRSLTQYS